MVVDVCNHSLRKARQEELGFKATLTYTGRQNQNKYPPHTHNFFNQLLKLFKQNKTNFSFV